MKEVFRSNNPVQISYVLYYLQAADIHAIELDRHASSIEGSISAIQRRILVPDEDASRALEIINHLGEEP